MNDPLVAQIARREAVLEQVRALLVSCLQLQRRPEEIDPDTPLFGAGLGLDSIDAVDLLVGIETTFLIEARDESLHGALRTVNTVVDLILKARAMTPADGGQP